MQQKWKFVGIGYENIRFVYGVKYAAFLLVYNVITSKERGCIHYFVLLLDIFTGNNITKEKRNLCNGCMIKRILPVTSLSFFPAKDYFVRDAVSFLGPERRDVR